MHVVNNTIKRTALRQYNAESWKNTSSLIIDNRMLLLMVISLFVAGCSSKPSYVVMAPNVFYVGVPQKIHVALFDIKKPQYIEMELHVKISSKPTQVIASQCQNVSQDNPRLFSMTVGPDFSEHQFSQERSFVFLIVRSNGPELRFSQKTKVNVIYSDGIILIQTDKPIYTPKQTVKIRVIPLGFDLMPSSKKVNLIVKNPHGTRVRQWENLNTTSGFINKDIDIGGYALEGSWTIEAYYGHRFLHNVSSRFEVREYVLPRFSVKMNNLLQYILPTSDSIEVTGNAKYTYGKPVQGNASVRLYIHKEPLLLLTKTKIKLVNGEFRHLVKMDKIKSESKGKWFPEGRRLHIQADVTEESTGKTERTMNSVYFVTSPYSIEYVNTARYFKPGLPFSIAVRVKYTHGEKLAMWIPMKLFVEAFGKDGVKINALNPNEQGIGWNRAYTDINGRAEFVINIARKVQRLEIEVKTNKKDIPREQNAVKTLIASASESKELMKLRQTNKPAKVGENAAVEAVLSSKKVDQLTYMVVSHGQIVYNGLIAIQDGRIITTVPFRVTSLMSPSARLIAYYVSKETGKVVSDSILLEVDDQFPNPIFVKDSDRRVEELPSKPYRIKILGTMGTNVGLLGVDQSVYLLSKSNILTAESVFKKQDGLDLGCGAGSGKTSKDVFKNAGMMVMSHDIVLSDKLECEEEHRRKTQSIVESTKQRNYCCSLGNKTDPIRSCSRRLKDLDLRIFSSVIERKNCRKNFLICCNHTGNEFIRARAGVATSGKLVELYAEEQETDVFDIQARQLFPETWINEELTISNQEPPNVCQAFLSHELLHKCGSAVLPVSLQDTMTTWVVQAMGVSSSTGFGMANPLHITTFKAFFIYLSMPYSVQRGEEITLMATLFNYKNYDVAVHIYLKGNEGFCSAAAHGKISKLTTSRKQIPPQGTISFPITIFPIKFGKVPIEVIAVSADYVDDRVLKSLNVVPEGIEEIISQSYELDPQGFLKRRNKREAHTNSKQINKIKLTVPKDAIPESISAKAYFTGNLIGKAIINLASEKMESLLQLPNGCGEQNMIRIAPNVYILHYLNKTKQMTPELEKKINDYIQKGYIHELDYRKKDGSFFFFRENNKGSTWLTAFVLKVFSQARKLKGINIDRNDLCQSAKWLIGQQRQDGAFIENANTNSIKGGVYTSDVSLTAAVVIALKQCQCEMPEVSSAIQSAVLFIEKSITAINDTYSLAITTYALALANSPEQLRSNQELRRRATYNPETSTRYWETNSKARNIETAGYALLAQVSMDRLQYAGPIVLWLTKQRRSFGGGFVSTADTCVALESIAKYSEHKEKFKIKLDLTIRMNGRIIVRITKDNALLQQEADLLDQIGKEITIETSGSGQGEMQVDIKYNVPPKEGERCDFDVKVTVTGEGSGCLISMNSSSKKNVLAYDRLMEGKTMKSKKTKNTNTAKNRKHGKCQKNKENQKKKQNKKNKRRKIEKNGKEKNKIKPLCPHPIPDKVVLSLCARLKTSGETGMAIIEVGIVTGLSVDEDTLIELVKKENNTIQRYELSERAVLFYLNKIDSAQETCVAFHLIRFFEVKYIQPVPVKVYDFYNPDIKCTIFYQFEDKKLGSFVKCSGGQCTCKQVAPEP